jgi:hypothetical protein
MRIDIRVSICVIAILCLGDIVAAQVILRQPWNLWGPLVSTEVVRVSSSMHLQIISKRLFFLIDLGQSFVDAVGLSGPSCKSQVVNGNKTHQ